MGYYLAESDCVEAVKNPPTAKVIYLPLTSAVILSGAKNPYELAVLLG